MTNDRDELRDALTAVSAGEPGGNAVLGAPVEGGLAFLFTGQGSQRMRYG